MKPKKQSVQLVSFESQNIVDFLSVTTEIEGDLISWTYLLKGNLSQIMFPHRSQDLAWPRQGNLWAETCFEAFIEFEDDQGQNRYLEFNFSPSGAWNAYLFDSYREGMRQFPETRKISDSFTLHPAPTPTQMSFTVKTTLTASLKLRNMGLTSILKLTNGETQYWALQHTAGRPDFHHRSDWTVSFDA